MLNAQNATPPRHRALSFLLCALFLAASPALLACGSDSVNPSIPPDAGDAGKDGTTPEGSASDGANGNSDSGVDSAEEGGDETSADGGSEAQASPDGSADAAAD
jgi:hypothetical protein